MRRRGPFRRLARRADPGRRRSPCSPSCSRVALPRSFFEDWGWAAGPAVWAVCALIAATALRLPLAARARRRGARRAAEPDRRAVGRALGRARRSASLLLRALVRPARARRARADGGGGLMDLGLAGRVALVTGGSKGIGARDRGRAGGRGRAGRGRRRATRSAIEAAAARIGAHGVVFDSDDLDAVAGRDRRRRARARARSTSTSRTPAARPAGAGPARLHARAVGGGAPHARPLADGVPRAAAAGHARARLGPRRRGRLDRGARADRRPPALQRPPARARSRRSRCSPGGRGRRRDAQHRAARAGSPPTGCSATRARARRPRPPRARRCRPAGSGTVEELAAAAVFLCSGAARPTSPARRCSSTAGSPRRSDRGATRLRARRAVSSIGRARDFGKGALVGKPLVRRRLFAGTPLEPWVPGFAPVKIPRDWAISRQPRVAGEPSEAIRRPP